MKRLLVIALLVPFALAACAVDPTTSDPGEGAPAAEPNGKGNENVGEAKSDLAVLDPSKYCLPGEVVKCTLGPPPVCHCEAAPVRKVGGIVW